MDRSREKIESISPKSPKDISVKTKSLVKKVYPYSPIQKEKRDRKTNIFMFTDGKDKSDEKDDNL